MTIDRVSSIDASTFGPESEPQGRATIVLMAAMLRWMENLRPSIVTIRVRPTPDSEWETLLGVDDEGERVVGTAPDDCFNRAIREQYAVHKKELLKFGSDGKITRRVKDPVEYLTVTDDRFGGGLVVNRHGVEETLYFGNDEQAVMGLDFAERLARGVLLRKILRIDPAMGSEFMRKEADHTRFELLKSWAAKKESQIEIIGDPEWIAASLAKAKRKMSMNGFTKAMEGTTPSSTSTTTTTTTTSPAPAGGTQGLVDRALRCALAGKMSLDDVKTLQALLAIIEGE